MILFSLIESISGVPQEILDMAKQYWLSDEGVPDNANLSIGSSTFGTDATAAIQAVLDIAGPKIIFWDTKSSISDTILIPNDTLIFGLNGAGVIARNNMNKNMFMNANPTLAGNTAVNISIIGMGGFIINGNGANQAHDTIANGWVTPIKFVGADNWQIKGVKILAPRTFHCWITKCNYWSIQDCYLDYGPGQNADETQDQFGNFDGIHINGATFFNILNITGRTFDDFIAFNANDVFQSEDTEATYNGYTSYDPYAYEGDITDFNVTGIKFMSGQKFGFRFLSSTNRIDRGFISDVSGSLEYQGVIMDHWPEGPPATSGSGNGGKILFRNIALEVTGGDYKDCYFYIGGKWDSIDIEMTRKNFTASTFPSVKIGTGADITNLRLKMEHVGGVNALILAHITAGTVHNMEVVDSSVLGLSSQISMPLVGITAGTIGRLVYKNINADKIDRLLHYYAGTIGSVVATGITHTNAGSGNGTFYIETGKTLADLEVNGYYGALITSGSGTVTKERGYAFVDDLP